MKIEKATQQCKQLNSYEELNHLHVFERISVIAPLTVRQNRIRQLADRTGITRYDTMINQEEVIVCK